MGRFKRMFGILMKLCMYLPIQRKNTATAWVLQDWNQAQIDRKDDGYTMEEGGQTKNMGRNFR